MHHLKYEFGDYIGGFDESTQRRHGEGMMTYNSGNAYQGHWHQGLFHGAGTKKYANGDVYSGNWCQGKREGFGRYAYASGHEFSGTYRDDVSDGFGKLTLARGAGSYEGGWRAGMKHGAGVERNRTSVRYEGEFAAGNRHGRGLLVDEAAGEEQWTQWENGNMCAMGPITKCDGAAVGHADGDDDQRQYENQSDAQNSNENSSTAATAAAGENNIEVADDPAQRSLLYRSQKQQQNQANAAPQPIADANSLAALASAGVSPEAVMALGAFSQGVESTFGALDRGVAGMEGQISGLMGALENLMGGLDDLGDDDVDVDALMAGGGADAGAAGDDEGLEYECDRGQSQP